MKKYIIIWLLIIWFWIWLYYISNWLENNEFSNSQIKIVNNDINLGEIPMDEWKVEIPFEFINLWIEKVVLWSAETSCMCTQWFVTDIDGWNKSIIIKMSWHGWESNLNRVIEANEKVKLIAIFDPNAHWPNATWPISRNVYINTNSTITKKLDFRFMWNVVKTRSNKQKQEIQDKVWEKEIFDFEEKSFDFWTIKQSGWKVKHDFKFTYNGKEPINITWVPTSCACTSATIDKTELNPWDTWILTVVFNPNLHEEPKWKFFKTVNLLTDLKLEEIPEVKIWVEIDLDLWEEAFELKSVHTDDNVDNVVQTKIVTLNANRWEYDLKEIRVKKWEKLIIKVNNIDTLHWIAIPDMQLVWDTQIEVDTSKTWEFEFRCSNYCWAGHQEMVWKLIIE